MAADGVPGAKNNPQFLGAGAPATAVDLNLISTYAALVGNRKTGTSSQRAALTGADIWPGLEFFETDTKLLYLSLDGTSWALWQSAAAPFAQAAGVAHTVLTTADTTVTLPVGRFTVAPLVFLTGSFVTASGATGGGAVVTYDPSPSGTHFTMRAIGVTGVDVYWHAIQMTPTTAAG